jgi:hypothetical protein
MNVEIPSFLPSHHYQKWRLNFNLNLYRHRLCSTKMDTVTVPPPPGAISFLLIVTLAFCFSQSLHYYYKRLSSRPLHFALPPALVPASVSKKRKNGRSFFRASVVPFTRSSVLPFFRPSFPLSCLSFLPRPFYSSSLIPSNPSFLPR